MVSTIFLSVILSSSVGIVSGVPVWIQVIFGSIVALLSAFGGAKGIIQLLRYLKGEKTVHRVVSTNSSIDIINHPIFDKLNSFIDHDVNMLNFGSDIHNKIFKIILNTQIREYNNHLYQLASNTSILKLDDSEFRCLVFKVYNDIVSEYNKNIKVALGVKISDLIMDHTTKGYNVWHEPVLYMIRKSIEDILVDDVYHNNYEVLFSILNIYKNSLDTIKMNVENAFRNFNGDLTKILKETH